MVGTTNGRNEFGNLDNARVDAFFAEIIEVCRKHGLSIGHEDGHGGFEVHRFDDRYSRWMDDASVMFFDIDSVPSFGGPS